MTSLTRRWALKILGVCASWFRLGRAATVTLRTADDDGSLERWSETHDRVWLGEQVWANPMEDWRVVDGAAECQSRGGDRNIHSLTHQLANPRGRFTMSVRISQVESGKKDGGAGFRIGVRSDLNEYRSNCFAKRGITAAVADGKLVLGRQSKPLSDEFNPDDFRLTLAGEPADGRFKLTLQATSADGATSYGRLKLPVGEDAVLGNLALVNNLDPGVKKNQGSRYRFREWTASGDALKISPEQKFGGVLWSMYTMSDSRGDEGFVVKLTALTGPLGEQDNKRIELVTQHDGQWRSQGFVDLDEDAWTATFRLPNWNEKTSAPFQLRFRERLKSGSEIEHVWDGVIRANPVDRLRLGALTCQNDYAFPYEPVAENLAKLDPDMLYFSGDQLYENHGGFGIIRDPAGPAILNYLRKFYQFGWSFGEVMRSRPTVCIPDDHDVFQGNIWGEGGAKMAPGSTSSKGGYREPARMVNVVHKTNASHHPDYYDPTPCKQGISVYYGDMVYGGVSFAILGDRQFKSGPERVETGSGRADHVKDPEFDTSQLDKPGLDLLGERQEEFLRAWVDDWRGCRLKALLSQTVFSGVATHHGGYDGYLKADLDSGGWPQTPRDRAVSILRAGMPLHINGDQHLATLSQYGVETQRDGCWAFCTPAIGAGYPRWWRPDEVGMEHANRPKHGLPHTGEYRDGFGNRVYVYAVGNPEPASKKHRYERAHQKGSGFGLVTFDLENKTYLLEAYRFLIDATDGKPTNQFPGWPVLIRQQENRGENIIG